MALKVFLPLLALIFTPLAWAHVEDYHAYTGWPFVSFALILAGGLVFYEKRGDTKLGLSVMASSVLLVSAIALLFPASPVEELSLLDWFFLFLVSAAPFAYFYALEK